MKLNPQNETPFKQADIGKYRIRERCGCFFPEQLDKDGNWVPMNGGVSFWSLQGARYHISVVVNHSPDIIHSYP